MEQQEIIDKYSYCLFEMRKRIEVVLGIVDHKYTTGILITDVELVSIQFRKIIELIALSSLVANIDEYSKQRVRFKEDWNARLIMQDLERINPQYFPTMCKMKQTMENGKKVFEFQHVDNGLIKKEQAISIYEKCSSLLHANNPFKDEKDYKAYNTLFNKWIHQIYNHMKYHLIFIIPENVIGGIMNFGTTQMPNAFWANKTDNFS